MKHKKGNNSNMVGTMKRFKKYKSKKKNMVRIIMMMIFKIVIIVVKIQLEYCTRIHCIRIWGARIQGGLHIFMYTKHIVLSEFEGPWNRIAKFLSYCLYVRFAIPLCGSFTLRSCTRGVTVKGRLQETKKTTKWQTLLDAERVPRRDLNLQPWGLKFDTLTTMLQEPCLQGILPSHSLSLPWLQRAGFRMGCSCENWAAAAKNHFFTLWKIAFSALLLWNSEKPGFAKKTIFHTLMFIPRCSYETQTSLALQKKTFFRL